MDGLCKKFILDRIGEPTWISQARRYPTKSRDGRTSSCVQALEKDSMGGCAERSSDVPFVLRAALFHDIGKAKENGETV